MPKVSAILVAGGSSARMGGVDKLFIRLAGTTVFERSLAALQNNALVGEIVVVAGEANLSRLRALSAPFSKVSRVVAGGPTRFDSVQNGVAAADPAAEYYAIHDAARPFAGDGLITAVIRAAEAFGASAPGIPLADTVKRLAADGTVADTPARDGLVAVQTPQVFGAALYRAAAKHFSGGAYDDCQIVERAGRKVCITAGDPANFKITTKDDIARARAMAGETAMRIGHGYDVHRLTEGRKLILGGVEIPFERGLLGHSDADVLAHAVMDALLGAAALPDIGAQFPDSDPAYEGADSMSLLAQVGDKVRGAGFAVGNVDATVVCQRPKLRPHIDAMRENIARALGIEAGRVGVKATTEEGLGFTGDGAGIAAHAVALLNAAENE
ncbi:MAG: 2-C-methyl-D-erythritol 2,4-cyclodiphosphate synthase [Oscillospiraceae bacterium]|nr:2-C-methyl-D-erythritol 2,4-cyclodiphosphate synthase [Oscillospiraceae bacterium]